MSIVSNHEMLPEYKTNDELEVIQDQMREFLTKWGAELGEGVYIADWPEVVYFDGDGEADPKDFKGSIVMKKGSGMLSTPFNPFQKGRVKITIKRVNGKTGKLIVGEGTCLNGVSIVCMDSVEIGDSVLFGANVSIMDTDGHVIDRTMPDDMKKHTSKPVKIGKGAWIGYGAIIMKGVTIGDYAVVAANSIVTKDVLNHGIVAGNPAKHIKTVEPEGDI